MAHEQHRQAARRVGPDLDAVIVGAGFAGLHMVYRLRELGLAARVFEAGSGVGGTIGGNGGAFHLSELTISALEVLFRVAQAADLAILPASGPPPPPWILTAEPQREHLPAASSGGETVVCESVAELCALLRGGVGEWKAFREMIAGGAV